MRTLQGKSISHKTLETHETFHWSTSSDARWNFERVQFFGNMFSGERDSVEVLTFKFSAVTGERELKTKGRKKDSLQHVEREGYGGPLGCERTPQICLETWTPTQTCPGPPHNGERMATHVQIANCQPRRYDGLWSSGGHENETDGGIIKETSHIPFGGIWSIPMLVTKSKVVKPPDDVL